MQLSVTSFCLGLFSVPVAAQLSDSEIRGLKSGRIPDDTSFVYTLPYETEKSFMFIQGSNSMFSHKNTVAYDFKMKTGSSIVAAREGVVVSSRGDSEEGGLKPEHLSDGNYIIIRHPDQSESHYWHLMKDGLKVSTGDSVKQGQLIGYSGNTGYSAFPHLHFEVHDAGGKSILVRFMTKNGARYLKPGKFYRRPSRF
jgi:murein DD-endopeptidase MepM/ murein hydrolase activator NlpD